MTGQKRLLTITAALSFFSLAHAGSTVSATGFSSVAQLKTWQAACDQFDQCYRPTGSPAHKAYVSWLTNQLRATGATVTTEPYTFEKWVPKTWSLQMLNGTKPGIVNLANYVPWSGQTGAAGVTTEMVHITSLSSAINQWMSSQSNIFESDEKTEAARASLKQALAQYFYSSQLAGKIVVIDLPKISIPYSVLSPVTYYKNDPKGIFNGQFGKDGSFGNLLVIPVIESLLATSGAKGFVGVLDYPEKQARGAYYPFFGLQAVNMPGVFVDRANGKLLKDAIAANRGSITTKLVLDASFVNDTDNNVIGVIPGPVGAPEIVVSTHTDGTNSLEDNGQVAMLAMAKYLVNMPVSQRPATFRFVMTGGHFVGSAGIRSYIKKHALDLKTVRAIIEVEHLGALEWDEVSPEVMGLTGNKEPGLIFTNLKNIPITGTDAAQATSLVNRSIEFAKKFPATLVLGGFPAGEGIHWRYPFTSTLVTPYPSIQFISNPSYLLGGRNLEITSKYTDYNLMRNQSIALLQMAFDLAENRWN